MRDDELKHYGVKGMKWGVRKAEKIGKSIKNHYSKSAKNVSKYFDKKPRLKKALKTTGRVAADVATLGVSRKIRKRENEIKKHGNDIMFRYEVGANAIGRAMKFQTRRKILDGVKMVAALAGAGAYVASKNNPKVKKGAMAAGKILNTLSNVSLATLAAYDVYDTYRDIRDVYSKKKGKE